MIQNSETTQSNKPITPARRGRTFLISALIFLVIMGIAIFAGIQQGFSIRKENKLTLLTQQLTEQFKFATDDIQAQRYEIARQRLEFIISNDPGFPGAQDKLTQVLVLMNAPTLTVTPSLTPTPDFSGAEQAYAKAGQLIAAQDWPGALGALDEMRKLNPAYQQSQVDGMYYFALRNYGYDLLTKQGNLEGGIYQLTLAERFGPLDRDANGVREGARVYIIGASFWELDWGQAVFYFSQARNWGDLWDGTMTSSARFQIASMRYGDELFAKGKICGDNEALAQYQNAQTISPLDKAAQSNFNQATLTCFPPTSTPALITDTPAAIIDTPTTAPTSYP